MINKEVINRESYTPMKRFFRLLKPDRREIQNIYVYAGFNGLISLSLPLGIQAIVNLIQGGQISTSWIVLVILVVIGVALTGLLQIFQLRITEDLQQRIFTRSAFEFAYRIPRIRLEALYNQYAPELMNRFFDTVSVQKGLSKILMDFSAAAVQVVFGLVLLSFYHPFFILFSLILLILLYAIFRFTAKRGLNSSLEESKYKYKVAHWLEEIARTASTFKLAGISKLPLNRMDRTMEGYLTAREEHFRVLVRQYYLMVGFKVLVATGLLAIGGILVMEQFMNIGQFIAAEIIILLVMSSVEKLILSLETIYDVLTALAKIGQVTDMELERSNGLDFTQKNRDQGLKIELKNVDFSYPRQSVRVLKDIDLCIEPGERIVITGANGCGKSTLVQLMAGLYQAESGSIMYDGLSVGNIEPSSLRSVMGDSLNQEFIFDGSILENITLGRENLDLEKVRWAAGKVGIDHFISSLPKGYNTELDPLGKKMPRSTVRKILLARSIADKPRLILLEDTLEHIDESDRQKIFEFLTSRENKWTLIAASNDSGLIQKADRVFQLKGGILIELPKGVNTCKSH